MKTAKEYAQIQEQIDALTKLRDESHEQVIGADWKVKLWGKGTVAVCRTHEWMPLVVLSEEQAAELVRYLHAAFPAIKEGGQP